MEQKQVDQAPHLAQVLTILNKKPRLVNFDVRGISFNRDKETSFIETEARYRRPFPGVGQYTKPHEVDWAKQLEKRNCMKFDKAKRTTVADDMIR